MDPILDIPKDRKRRSALWLCFILAGMGLLFLMIVDDFGALAGAVLGGGQPG